VVTGLSELQRTGGQVLVTSMCIGSGESSRLLCFVQALTCACVQAWVLQVSSLMSKCRIRTDVSD